MPKDWELVRSELLADLKLFSARFDYMKNPRNGVTEKMIVLETPDATNVVAVTQEQAILFVRQYRFGISAATLELPGGLVDAGETHAEAAPRELREETGYSGGEWTHLGSIPSNPVFMTNSIHHYLAENVRLTHQLNLDVGEDLRVETMPVADVLRHFREGAFQHPHTVNGLLRFFIHKKMI